MSREATKPKSASRSVVLLALLVLLYLRTVDCSPKLSNGRTVPGGNAHMPICQISWLARAQVEETAHHFLIRLMFNQEGETWSKMAMGFGKDKQ